MENKAIRGFLASVATMAVVTVNLSSLLGTVNAQEGIPIENPISYPKDELVKEENQQESKNLSEQINIEASSAKPSIEKSKLENYLQAKNISKERFDTTKTQVAQKLQGEHAKDLFFVKFVDDQENDTKIALHEEVKSIVGNEPVRGGYIKRSNNFDIVKINPEVSLEDQMALYAINPNVELVEPNYIFKKSIWSVTGTTAKPDDWGSDSKHWYHVKTKLPEVFKAQGCGTANDYFCGGTNTVTIAVIDTGVAYEDATLSFDYYNTNYTIDYDKSPQLSTSQLWSNKGETYGGGDDDINSFCDDVYGLDADQYYDNFLDWYLYDMSGDLGSGWKPAYKDLCQTSNDLKDDGRPNDDDGHGTFVTSILSSTIDDGLYSFGMVPNAKIMSIKALDYTGAGTSLSVGDAIFYAAYEGAHIVNLSLGTDEDADYIRSMVTYARDRGTLLVAATGNDGTSVDYPAKYSAEFNNVIAVGATETDDSRSSYSNYGAEVDIVAPVHSGSTQGSAVTGLTFADTDSNEWDPDVNFPNKTLDTLAERSAAASFKNFDETYLRGTSFAAPQVTGAAAMLMSKNSALTAAQVKSILRNTASRVSDGVCNTEDDNQVGCGIVNIKAAWDVTVLNSWGDWEKSGASLSQVSLLEFEGKIVEAISGIDNVARVRILNADGTVYRDWERSGSSVAKVALASHGDKLFVSLPGVDGFVRTRIFDLSENAWGEWNKSGASYTEVTLETAGAYVFQGIRGIDNVARVRILNADGTVYRDWERSGSSMAKVALENVGNSVFTSVSGVDGFVRTRRYDLNTHTWNDWNKSGASNMEVNLIALDTTKLAQSITGLDKVARVRILNSDGTVSNDWERSGSSTKPVATAYIDNTLVLSIVGEDTYVRTRFYSPTLNLWGAWDKSGASNDTVTLQTIGVSNVYQGIRGTDNVARIRLLNINTGVVHDWVRSGSTLAPVEMEKLGSDRMFVAIPGIDTYVRNRITYRQ